MKLIVFLEKGNEVCNQQADLISKLASNNLLDRLSQKERDNINEDLQLAITSVSTEKYFKSKKKNPIMINFYEIKTYPTVVFINDNEVIYRWENKVPEVLEVVVSIKNYLKILKSNIMDYNYDPEE